MGKEGERERGTERREREREIAGRRGWGREGVLSYNEEHTVHYYHTMEGFSSDKHDQHTSISLWYKLAKYLKSLH